MNLSQKCNCCLYEPVCKYKEIYQRGIEAILNATILLGKENGKIAFTEVKNCSHIEVSVKCPHMVVKSQVKGG